jgi:hypothetical protein
MAKGRGTKARSAISGRYVSKRYAKSHPKTTVNERSSGRHGGGKGRGKKK